MKKVLSFIIICTMFCLSTLPCYAYFWPQNGQSSVDLSNSNISGETQATLDELAEVVANVHDFFIGTHFGMPVNNNSIIPPGYDTTYHKVREADLPGGSFDGMVSIANNLFASDIAEKTYTYYSITQQIPLFYSNNDGLFASELSFGHQIYTMRIFHYMNSPKMYFDNMVITDTTALGRVLYCTAVDGPLEDLGPLYWFDVAFEKDINGIWKMADCALFRLYFDSRDFNRQEFICYNRELYNQFGVKYNLDSPSTSDPAFNLVFILPTVSVAALASAFCLMLRRRDLI